MVGTVWLSAALAAPPEVAVAVAPSVSGGDARAEVQGRLRLGEVQVGVTGRWAEVRRAWIDGWPVDDGTARSALAHVAVPIARSVRFRFDLRANVGARWLAARETLGPIDRSVALLTEVGPRANLGLSDRVAVQLGFDQITDFQVDPSFATDGLGQLLTASAVAAPGRDWQLALTGETGGLYGYDGDGAKYAARIGLSVRFAPGAAASWLWL